MLSSLLYVVLSNGPLQLFTRQNFVLLENYEKQIIAYFLDNVYNTEYISGVSRAVEEFFFS